VVFDYTAPLPGRVTVRILSMQGQTIFVYQADQNGGRIRIEWDGSNPVGWQCGAGLYMLEVRGPLGITRMPFLKLDR
jgi:flagellar hook assembly protein FlgD